MLPNPILEFTLFGKEVQVYMYGVCIAIGLLACFGVLVLYSKSPDKERDIRNNRQQCTYYDIV
jgi:hypothetical protein